MFKAVLRLNPKGKLLFGIVLNAGSWKRNGKENTGNGNSPTSILAIPPKSLSRKLPIARRSTSEIAVSREPACFCIGLS